MRDYGKVYTRFWLKPEVHGWSDNAKLLSLYLLTCHHCNLIGCFRLPTGYIAEDLNWESAKVAATLTELINYDFIIRCNHSGWTLISHYLRHNPIENPNQGKAAIRLLEDVPKDFIGMPQLQNALHYFSSRLPANYRITEENENQKIVSLNSKTNQENAPQVDSSSNESKQDSDINTPSLSSESENTTVSFEHFWQLQIRKEKKTQAETEWKRLGLDKNTKLAKNVITIWQEQKAHRHQYKDKTKTPMPHNWLLHRQWEDEYVRSDDVDPSVLKPQFFKNLSLEQANQHIAKTWANSQTG